MRTVKLIPVFALIVLLVAGAIGFVYYNRALEPYKGYEEAEQFVDIPPGSTTRVIGEKLVRAGIVRDIPAFRLALWQTGAGRQLRAGEYRFDRPMTPIEVVRKIARGEVYLLPITFREGLTIDEMAALFESHGFGTAAAFRKAASDASLIMDLDPAARDLEGYLFPETYSLPRHAQASDLVRMMVRRFREVFTPLVPEIREITVREVVTLASIVEKETGKADERPTVAAVYLNRLRIGMGLQCDPTVIYGLRKTRRYNGNLTRENLALDTPYNTYLHAGLPPGPIAAPGKASLAAAVNPAPVDYLYFVSRNDGSHEFARTLDEHNRNVLRYQKLYFRQRH